jgi:hypothetical protein
MAPPSPKFPLSKPQQGETDVVRIISIGIAGGALAIAALPVRADDQARGLILNQLGGYGLSAQSDDQQAMYREHGGMRRTAPSPRVSGDVYGAFAGAGAYGQTCGHVGGPKGGTWVCR